MAAKRLNLRDYEVKTIQKALALQLEQEEDNLELDDVWAIEALIVKCNDFLKE